MTVEDSNSDDIATQKLNELRAKASKDFSEDEVNDFINSGKKLASKAVLSALICVIKEGSAKNLSADEATRLTKKIEKLMPYNYSGFVQCAFKETSYLLNICLSLVDKDYKTDIDIPHASYARDLFQQYDFLKNIAVAYWKQFCEEQPELLKRIADYRRDVDFSQLIIDPNNPTTMYFDPECARRVGLFAYYVDQQGRPFYKKKK